MNLLNGISYGMLLFLVASGLAIVLGLMGILNLTHGALYMVGGYIGWTIAVQFGLNFWLAVFLGGLVAGLVGLVIERQFFRRLYKQPNEQVLVAFGFVYILTNLCVWIWDARFRAPFTAAALRGSVDIGDFTYPITRLTIILIGLVIAAGLWWLQERTRVGAIVRAGMDNKEMTIGLGINLERVSMLVFFLAAFIAGLAGVIGAQMLGVHPMLSLDMLLPALIIIIIGGTGSVQGALLGAIMIGLIDAFGRMLFPQFAMFTIYIAMTVMLMVRPSGLMGRKI
jgi:branched-chain amino acid transport system permease protein